MMSWPRCRQAKADFAGSSTVSWLRETSYFHLQEMGCGNLHTYNQLLASLGEPEPDVLRSEDTRSIQAARVDADLCGRVGPGSGRGGPPFKTVLPMPNMPMASRVMVLGPRTSAASVSDVTEL